MLIFECRICGGNVSLFGTGLADSVSVNVGTLNCTVTSQSDTGIICTVSLVVGFKSTMSVSSV